MGHEKQRPQQHERRNKQQSNKPQQETELQPPHPEQLQRRLANPNSLTPAQINYLQRTIGNRAVAQMFAQKSGRSHAQGQNRQPASTLLQRAPVPASNPDEKSKNLGDARTQLRTGRAADSTYIEKLNPSAPNQGTGNGFGKAATGTEMGAEFTDISGSLMGNLASAPKSAKYDEVKQNWLLSQGLSPDTRVSDLTNDQKDALNQEQIQQGGKRAVVEDAGKHDSFDVAATGVGVLTEGLGAAAGFLGMVQSIKQYRAAKKEGEDTTDPLIDLIHQGAQGTLGSLKTVTNLGGLGSGIAAMQQGADSPAATAASSF